MSNLLTFRMSGQTLMQIDEYEKEHFAKSSKLLERCLKVIPGGEHCQLDFVMASSADKTVSVIYTVDGVQGHRLLPIEEKGSLGNLLFLHAITTAVVTGALEAQYGFAYCYFYAQKLANAVVPGEPETYPKYIERLLPTHFAESDDYEFNAFRFTMIGEARDPENTIALRAVVRYAVISSDSGMASNFNEVFPVMQLGPYITFNAYVPFTCQLIGPQDNDSILPITEEKGLHIRDAVEVINDKRFTISSKSGIADEELAVVNKMQVM